MSLAKQSPPGALPDDILLDAALARGDAPKALRAALQGERQILQERFLGGVAAATLIRQHAAWVDDLLLRIWRYFWPPADSPDIALVAAGGYGRSELHPGSDIDLLILLADDQHASHQKRIEQFISLLWDIGLEVGHSVRSVPECTHEAVRDITVATTLMEARLLTGSDTLFQAMCTAVSPARLWTPREFFAAKLQEQSRRHRKYHDTAYNLEPNIKDGPGGLRDIQTVLWVAQRHYGSASLHDLVEHGLLTAAEHATLTEAQHFLWQIRFGLHTLTQRREDRLLFDHQRSLARQFGYENEGHLLAVEQFMKRYYRTVMELSRLNEMLLQLFQEAILYADTSHEPVTVNKRFQARNDFIEVSHAKVFQHHPFALLEIFLLLAQHAELKGVRASTIRLIRDHRYLIDDVFRADLRCRSLFMELLRQPRGITHELRRMNRYGILAAYLPAFGNVVGQMQHDLFHVYTVDEHTLFLVRNLRRFALPELAHEFPLCSEIFQQLPKTELLYLAGLFHDIAKGRGGDHSELGAADALDFCLHHGLSQYDARLVAWLVRHHLVMSSTAQRQDLSDPDVIANFAARVGDQVHLDYLYLLTVADIRATSPALWNSWKSALLADLYVATKRVLRQGLTNSIDQQERICDTQLMARQLLQQYNLQEDAVAALWRQLEDDYFLRHSVDEIVWHTQAIVRADPHDLPLILIRQQTHRGGTEIFLYTQDQDHLFAATTTALDQLGLTVVDARIVTARSGYTLDTYIVLEESGETISDGYRIAEIAATLRQQLLTGTLDTQVTRRARRQLQHFPITTEISFRQDSRQRTVMEIICADRPGLLSRIARAFTVCGVRLHNAKIATFGARAEDIFFITDMDNRPLCDEARFTCLRDTLTRSLNP
jgi:[protein-PII] uridylyltransferase